MHLFLYALLHAGLPTRSELSGQLTARQDSVPVTIVITNLPSTTSAIKLNFYNSAATFLKSGQAVLRRKIVPQNQNQVRVQVMLLPGEWAVALSQDVNNNGKMDRNMLGIPTEPYAFSNNVRPHFRAPHFDECKFKAEGESQTVTIRLEK